MVTTLVLALVVVGIGAYGAAVLARDAPRPLWPPREPDQVVGRDDPGEWKRRRDRVGRGWAMVVVAIVLVPMVVFRLLS